MMNMKWKSQSKSHFSIRKYSIGAASVLLGTSLICGTTVLAEQALAGEDGQSATKSVVEAEPSPMSFATSVDTSDATTLVKEEPLIGAEEVALISKPSSLEVESETIQDKSTFETDLPKQGNYQYKQATEVRNSPKLEDDIVFYAQAGDRVYYDQLLDADGYRWLSYVSYSGTRRYVALDKLAVARPVSTDVSTSKPERKATAASSVLPQSGTYHFEQEHAVKNTATQSAATEFTFNRGDKVHYDRLLEEDGYRWLSYVSYSGTRRYVVLDKLAVARPVSTNVATSKPERKATADSSILPQSGTYHFEQEHAVKNTATQSAATEFTFNRGDKVHYDRLLEEDGYRWLSYVSYSGTRRYVALDKLVPTRPVSIDVATSKPERKATATSSVLPQSGTYHFEQEHAVKNTATQSAAVEFTFNRGDKVHYDRLLEEDGYRWLSYVSYSGTRRYVALDKLAVARPVSTDVSTSKPERKATAASSVLPQSGTYHFEQEHAVKNTATQSAAVEFTFNRGDKVRYDRLLEEDGYRWLSYVSYSGTRRYVALDKL